MLQKYRTRSPTLLLRGLHPTDAISVRKAGFRGHGSGGGDHISLPIVRSSVILCHLAHSLPSSSPSGRHSSCAPTARVSATHCNRYRRLLLYPAFSLLHEYHRMRVEIFLARVSPALVPTHSRPHLAYALHLILPLHLCTVSLSSAPSPSCSSRHPTALPSRPRRMRGDLPVVPVLSPSYSHSLADVYEGTTVGVVSYSPPSLSFISSCRPLIPAVAE